MGREERVAAATARALNSYSSVGVTVSTAFEQINDIPRVEKHFNGEEISNGKRILLRDRNGSPLLPVSADYIELMDMYAELAKRVFYLEARLDELKGRDGNKDYERAGQSVVLESPVRTI